jgi:hypothetical protein
MVEDELIIQLLGSARLANSATNLKKIGIFA